MQSKKANVSPGMQTLIVGVIMLVVAGFVIAVGASITQNQQTTFLTNTAGCNSTTTAGCNYAFNSSGQSLAGLNVVAQQQSSLGGILILAVFIAILFGVLGYVAFKKE